MRQIIINGAAIGSLSAVILSIPGVDLTTVQYYIGMALAFVILVNSLLD